MDWQDKQKQHRLGELESIKHTLSSPLYSVLRPNDPLSSTLHRRKSLLLLHNAHQQRRLSRPMMSIEDPPSPTTTDSQQSLETIQQNDADSLVQSISHCRVSEPVNERSSATLDRSRLTIVLPYSLNTTHASAGTPPSPEPIFIPDSRSDYEVSPTSSLDDVAEIDTELNVTFLSQENQAEANLVLYSKAIIHRSVAFRSLSPRKNTRETGVDKEDSISWIVVYSGLKWISCYVSYEFSFSSEALPSPWTPAGHCSCETFTMRCCTIHWTKCEWNGKKKKKKTQPLTSSSSPLSSPDFSLSFSFLNPASFLLTSAKTRREEKRKSKNRPSTSLVLSEREKTGIDCRHINVRREHTLIIFTFSLSVVLLTKIALRPWLMNMRFDKIHLQLIPPWKETGMFASSFDDALPVVLDIERNQLIWNS